MSEQKIRGKCPKCGEMLEIPQGLEKFSCLYCGAKLVLDELAMEYPEGNFDEAMANYKAHMLDAMWDYERCQKDFTRKKYTGAFADFKQTVREPFTQLDLACRLRPLERETVLTDAVTAFLDGLQSVLEADKRWKHRGQQERVLFDVKFAVALYLVPAVRDLEPRSCTRSGSSAIPNRPIKAAPTPTFLRASARESSASSPPPSAARRASPTTAQN